MRGCFGPTFPKRHHPKVIITEAPMSTPTITEFILVEFRPVINGETYRLRVHKDGRVECPHSREFAIGLLIGVIASVANSSAMGPVYEALEFVKQADWNDTGP